MPRTAGQGNITNSRPISGAVNSTYGIAEDDASGQILTPYEVLAFHTFSATKSKFDLICIDEVDVARFMPESCSIENLQDFALGDIIVQSWDEATHSNFSVGRIRHSDSFLMTSELGQGESSASQSMADGFLGGEPSNVGVRSNAVAPSSPNALVTPPPTLVSRDANGNTMVQTAVPVSVPRQNVTTHATADASHRSRRTEANFMCPIPGCGSTFTRHFNLKGHLRSHNEERPFKCKWPGCDKAFARQHDCERHEDTGGKLHPSSRKLV